MAKHSQIKIDMMEIDATIERLVGTQQPKQEAFSGAHDGAKQMDKQMALWSPPLQSADGEILPDKLMLDARSRDIARNDSYVQGAVQVHKDSIVGSMFVLNAKPNVEILGWTDDRAEAFQKEVEAKFQTWADSPHKWVDAARQLDLTALLRMKVSVYMMGGESLMTAEWVTDKAREFKTCVQMIDTDRLTTPFGETNNPRVRSGIETNKYGQPIAAFIRVTHPTDYSINDPKSLDHVRVPFYNKFGRKKIIFIREQHRPDQTRGISDLTSGLREMAIMKKFKDVTLQSAVVNATYAASIESELPSEVVFQQLGGGNVSSSVTNYATAYLSAVSDYTNSARNMQIDGAKVPHLFPGTKLQMRPAGNPGGVGQEFEQSLLRHLAAGLNISYEELSKDYSQTNYSSARAGMMQTYRFMRSRKKAVADEAANAIYRLWLEEAINADKIATFPASEAGNMYSNGSQNMFFDALTQADWIGAARGQIDELKETQAAVLRIKYGLGTHEEELSRLGKDWRKVYVQLERERKEREVRGIELEEDNSVNAASGSPREPDDVEESADK